MSSTDDEPIVFPSACPACKAVAGFPYMAATQPGRTDVIRLGMRCRQCRHEWTSDMATIRADFVLRDPET